MSRAYEREGGREEGREEQNTLWELKLASSIN